MHGIAWRRLAGQLTVEVSRVGLLELVRKVIVPVVSVVIAHTEWGGGAWGEGGGDRFAEAFAWKCVAAVASLAHVVRAPNVEGSAR